MHTPEFSKSNSSKVRATCSNADRLGAVARRGLRCIKQTDTHAWVLCEQLRRNSCNYNSVSAKSPEGDCAA